MNRKRPSKDTSQSLTTLLEHQLDSLQAYCNACMALSNALVGIELQPQETGFVAPRNQPSNANTMKCLIRYQDFIAELRETERQLEDLDYGASLNRYQVKVLETHRNRTRRFVEGLVGANTTETPVLLHTHGVPVAIPTPTERSNHHMQALSAIRASLRMVKQELEG